MDLRQKAVEEQSLIIVFFSVIERRIGEYILPGMDGVTGAAGTAFAKDARASVAMVVKMVFIR